MTTSITATGSFSGTNETLKIDDSRSARSSTKQQQQQQSNHKSQYKWLHPRRWMMKRNHGSNSNHNNRHASSIVGSSDLSAVLEHDLEQLATMALESNLTNNTTKSSSSLRCQQQQQQQQQEQPPPPGIAFLRLNEIQVLGGVWRGNYIHHHNNKSSNDCALVFPVEGIALRNDKNINTLNNNNSAVGCVGGEEDDLEVHAMMQILVARQLLQKTAEQKTHQYALKRLPTRPPSRDKKKKLARGLQKLINEAKILAKIGDHPNILSLRGLPLDLCSSSLSSSRNSIPRYDDFFIVTDRLLGLSPGPSTSSSRADTLDRRIRRWRQESSRVAAATPTATTGRLLRYDSSDPTVIVPPNDEWIPRKTNYAFQIAKALRACHERGIIVRDLSPHNIGFAYNDPHLVQLFDLGHAMDNSTTMVGAAATAAAATLTADQQRSHSIFPTFKKARSEPLVGKRRYMSGEIWMTGKYTPKADVYSWAMILFEMCTESKPYLGLTTLEHQRRVCEGGERPDLDLFCLPETIEELLVKAWNPDVSQRLNIYEVCERMQTLLLKLDSNFFYEPLEGDFLFDLLVHPKEGDDKEDSVSDLDDDDVLSLGPDQIFESTVEDNTSQVLDEAPSVVTEDQLMTTAFSDRSCASDEDWRRRARMSPTKSLSFTTLSSVPESPRRMMPSAA